ncbi:MAG: hypothetical protein AABN95_03485 [Acidobacteriota bacterium]
MQTRIGHLHITYRVPQNSTSASVLIPTLERVTSDRIAAVCDQAFAEVFADDPTVRVIRRVSTRVAIVSRRTTLESRIAEQWGHRLCAAVVESIVEDNNENVVSFENQAEFVSSFLTELTTGDAWSRWYYGAFGNYRQLAAGEAILAVLDDNREWLWEILRRLRQSRTLETVLVHLGLAGQQKLWKEIIRAAPQQESTEAFQVFVNSALSVLDALGLWTMGRPAEQSILESYLRTLPGTPQWTNTRSLSDALADVIQFVVSQRWVNSAGSLSDNQIVRLEQTLAHSFDWLDIPHVTRRVLSMFQSSSAQSLAKQFVLRPSSATGPQKRALEQLVRFVREGKCRLGPNDDDLHANLLRLLLTVSEENDSTSPAALAPLLESIVSAWLALRDTRDFRGILSTLGRGSIPIIGEETERRFNEETTRHLEVIATSGKPAIALVEELLKQSGIAPSDDNAVLVRSECAGLFLLVRTLQDVRLKAVLSECDFKSLESVLIGLAVCLGGPSAWRSGALDEGAALWAGIDANDVTDKLNLLETLNHELFEAAFEDLLSAQRLSVPVAGQTIDDVSQFLPCSADALVMLNFTACRLLQAWARWLPGLSHSSVSYLLSNFIRRSGTIAVSPLILEVRLSHGPLDTILRMAGYLEETPAASWLVDRRVRFRIGD